MYSAAPRLAEFESRRSLQPVGSQSWSSHHRLVFVEIGSVDGAPGPQRIAELRKWGDRADEDGRALLYPQETRRCGRTAGRFDFDLGARDANAELRPDDQMNRMLLQFAAGDQRTGNRRDPAVVDRYRLAVQEPYAAKEQNTLALGDAQDIGDVLRRMLLAKLEHFHADLVTLHHPVVEEVADRTFGFDGLGRRDESAHAPAAVKLPDTDEFAGRLARGHTADAVMKRKVAVGEELLH